LLDCLGHRTGLSAPRVQVAGPTPHYVLGLPNGHDPVRPNARLVLTMELPRSSESDACTGLGKSCGVHNSPEVCTHAKPETPLTWDNTGSVGGLRSHTPSVPSGSGVLLAAVQQACVLKPFEVCRRDHDASRTAGPSTKCGQCQHPLWPDKRAFRAPSLVRREQQCAGKPGRHIALGHVVNPTPSHE
jgi:hypothetical protein